MGVPHLGDLREFLFKHKDKCFSRTYLRDELRQNFKTIKQNLEYLVYTERSVVIKNKDNKVIEYQWKNE